MPRSDQLLSLMKSHLEGDEEAFLTVAMQMAAYEAKQGHSRVASSLVDLVDKARRKRSIIQRSTDAVPIAQARGELANLISATYPKVKLSRLVVSDQQRAKLRRIITEQQNAAKIEFHGLRARKKILLVGPPGSGKTLTASALAGELRIPLFTILLEGVITKYLGETATKLRVIFDAMQRTRGLFLFDEFDAIGTRRNAPNDVGEVRRILNSFLTLLENDPSNSLIVCATNHPELLDPALFRRFDDVIEYHLPTAAEIEHLFKDKLQHFDISGIDWKAVTIEASGLSQAEIVRACEEAAKSAVLEEHKSIREKSLLEAVQERKQARRQLI